MSVRVSLTSAAGVALVVLAMLFTACSTGSSLVVHNRTNLAIVFGSFRGDHYVAPCSSTTYAYDGDWSSDQPQLDPVLDAVRIRIDAYPPADSTLATVVIVTPESIYHYAPDAVPSLPPCGGVPPSPPG